MPNRRREWEDFLINEVGGTGTQDSAILSAGTIGTSKGKTLVRMIIGLHVASDGFSISALAGMNVSMGIGMISEEAFVGGAFPDPNSQTEHPLTGWMWRWRGQVYENILAGGNHRIDVDIRSQRKIGYGTPALIINYDLNGGADFSVSVLGLIRCLYLLE